MDRPHAMTSKSGVSRRSGSRSCPPVTPAEADLAGLFRRFPALGLRCVRGPLPPGWPVVTAPGRGSGPDGLSDAWVTSTGRAARATPVACDSAILSGVGIGSWDAIDWQVVAVVRCAEKIATARARRRAGLARPPVVVQATQTLALRRRLRPRPLSNSWSPRQRLRSDGIAMRWHPQSMDMRRLALTSHPGSDDLETTAPTMLHNARCGCAIGDWLCRPCKIAGNVLWAGVAAARERLARRWWRGTSRMRTRRAVPEAGCSRSAVRRRAFRVSAQTSSAQALVRHAHDCTFIQ